MSEYSSNSDSEHSSHSDSDSDSNSDSDSTPSMTNIDWSHLVYCSPTELAETIRLTPHLVPINTYIPTSTSPPHDYTGKQLRYFLHQGHTLITLAISTHNIERFQILTTHPIEKPNVNIRIKKTQETPLLSCTTGEWKEKEEKEEAFDRIKSLITLLCCFGANPNLPMYLMYECALTPLHYTILRKHQSAMIHMLETFTAKDVIHPIDFTVLAKIPSSGDNGNGELEMRELTIPDIIASQAPELLTTFQDTIQRCNDMRRQPTISARRTFLLATHPRLGATSSVFQTLFSSPLYDSHILRCILQFLPIPPLLPSTSAEIKMMRIKHAQAHTEVLQSSIQHDDV